jgi:hypothetical protein
MVGQLADQLVRLLQLGLVPLVLRQRHRRA